MPGMQEEELGLPRARRSPLLAEEAAVSLLCSKDIVEILVADPFSCKGTSGDQNINGLALLQPQLDPPRKTVN